jgi:hypothetical protein
MNLPPFGIPLALTMSVRQSVYSDWNRVRTLCTITFYIGEGDEVSLSNHGRYPNLPGRRNTLCPHFYSNRGLLQEQIQQSMSLIQSFNEKTENEDGSMLYIS